MSESFGIVMPRRTLITDLGWSGPGPSAAFTPASLTGLLGWYKADTQVYNDAGTTLATNGQTVAQWNDQSGNNNHLLQPVSNNAGVYQSAGFNSLPTVRFTPIVFAPYMSAASIAMGTGSQASCFIVGQLLSASGTFSRLAVYAAPGQNGTGVNSCDILFKAGSAGALQSNQNGTTIFGGVTEDANVRMGVVYDGVNATIYVNNVVAGGPTAVVPTWATGGIFYLNSEDPGGTATSQILASEVVFTKGTISGTDLTSLDNYFKAKWGL